MASVTSLDKDLRNMRLSKYTPQAANEIREWIELSLGEKLAAGDLLDALKDGAALCKLVNLAAPTAGIKFKKSTMPFVQMENISHFLNAIQKAPFSLPPHDVFLTVDLYEAKDPAQVLQCIGSFSRRAHTLQPSVFTSSIGPRSRNDPMSPQSTGKSGSGRASPVKFDRARGYSNASQNTSYSSPAPRAPATPLSTNRSGNSTTPQPSSLARGSGSATEKFSSWSNKNDEGATAPAWNIHQYGYLGGASQGNQGISFGARRQITSAGPVVPTLADKERRRREEAAEEERLRQQAEEAEEKRRIERDAEEERERAAEERRWEEETRIKRERDRQQAEEDKRKWEEDERQWKEDEKLRKEEEQRAQVELKMKAQRDGARSGSDTRLTGQFLSQYQAEQKTPLKAAEREDPVRAAERKRMRELENELAEAREREKRYELERQERIAAGYEHDHNSPKAAVGGQRTPSLESWQHDDSHLSRNEAPTDGNERDFLQSQWETHHDKGLRQPASSPGTSQSSNRPLPDPKQFQVKKQPSGPSRPLPDPASYSANRTRTDQFLATNEAPAIEKPKTHFPSEIGFDSNAERHAENERREASQAKTKAGGWASKSLLEREMELERERQREWEDAQKATEDASRRGVGKGVPEGTVGEGGSWDVNQYGFTGGDNQNRGGVNFGGRRQIIGPRPPPQR
ncbi:MAG: hypothetical protein M4579_002698 [Chaenotheca gracillima]|nr:MAG: hypothetical protein M4579_002698 [Chaenotheca gracillima]